MIMKLEPIEITNPTKISNGTPVIVTGTIRGIHNYNYLEIEIDDGICGLNACKIRIHHNCIYKINRKEMEPSKGITLQEWFDKYCYRDGPAKYLTIEQAEWLARDVALGNINL